MQNTEPYCLQTTRLWKDVLLSHVKGYRSSKTVGNICTHHRPAADGGCSAHSSGSYRLSLAGSSTLGLACLRYWKTTGTPVSSRGRWGWGGWGGLWGPTPTQAHRDQKSSQDKLLDHPQSPPRGIKHWGRRSDVNPSLGRADMPETTSMSCFALEGVWHITKKQPLNSRLWEMGPHLLKFELSI